MAETLVNLLIERLASVTVDKIGRELNLVIGVDDEVANLTRNLKLITAVLQDAEERQLAEACMGRQVTGASVRHWLTELNQVANEMEDVLDEWSTEILKQQLLQEEEEGLNRSEALQTTESSSCGKVCFPVPSCFACCSVKQLVHRPSNIIHRVRHRHDIAVSIQSLNKRLAEIAKQREMFNFQERKAPEVLPARHPTTSLINDASFGRETERDLLVAKLLDESHKKRGPLIIPIIGMGGIGKTTLCQLVYNHDKVKSHFQKRVWVCVSDPFDVIKISEAIIESLDNKSTNSSNSNELEYLISCIKELIKEKKFLLVLDDVWNPSSAQWEELIKPLLDCVTGSKILVTTRKKEAAHVMGASNNIVNLKELNVELTRVVFNHFAFLEREDVITNFEEFVPEFLEKCKGLPLAAKSLGSLMRRKKTKKEWRDVLKSPIWNLDKFAEEVFQPLLLSYSDLPPTMRRCLLYCVTFPKDHVINKDELIELWMSQDYLYKKGKTKEEIGHTYFEDLAMRSFFQEFEKDDDGNIRRCKMHDIMHDLLQYLTVGECCVLDRKSVAAGRMELPNNNNVRHLTLMFATSSLCLNSSPNCTNLRSLAAFTSSFDTIEPQFITSQLKRVRSINLSDSDLCKVPKEIGELVHLRYLDLSHNDKLVKLPDTIGDLYNLQTLRLVRCEELVKVPDLRKLINLKHLYVEGSHSLELKGIAMLRNLQTMDEFHVKDNVGRLLLEDLEKMDKLQGSLSIQHLGTPSSLETEQVTSGAKKAQLSKKRLVHLKLNFQCYCTGRMLTGEDNGRILNALRPHPDLESLSILRCMGATFIPDWLISLHNLKRLTLEMSSLKCLPPLGTSLPSLESLHIKVGLLVLQKIGLEFLGIDGDMQKSSTSFKVFPKLRHLSFSDMYKWQDWEGVVSHNISIMPRLSSLTLSDCWHLKKLPDFLLKTPLQHLHIRACRTLFSVYYGGSNDSWTTSGEEPAPINEEFNKISHISNIKLYRR